MSDMCIRISSDSDRSWLLAVVLRPGLDGEILFDDSTTHTLRLKDKRARTAASCVLSIDDYDS